MTTTLGVTSVLARIIGRANALTHRRLDAGDHSILCGLCCLFFTLSTRYACLGAWDILPYLGERIVFLRDPSQYLRGHDPSGKD